MGDAKYRIIRDGVSENGSGTSFAKYAIIVAGGSGLRAGGGVPKQFRKICGRPMLWWSLKAFRDEDPSTGLVVVINKDFAELWDKLFAGLPEEDRIAHLRTSGGETRFDSVKRGLALLPAERQAFVAVHDAARPGITPEVIGRGWRSSIENSCGAVPVVAVTDSLRMLTDGGSVAVDRSRYRAVQTPQVFPLEIIRKAYEAEYSPLFTDDASVVESGGYKCMLYEGDAGNFKVTGPEDASLMETIMNDRFF